MCDVCGSGGEAFVHASSIGPMSFASCRECLKRTAEPAFGFAYLYDFVSRDGEGLHEGVKQLSTFMEGKYYTWMEWVEWRQHPDRKSALDAARDKEIEDYNRAGEVDDPHAK